MNLCNNICKACEAEKAYFFFMFNSQIAPLHHVLLAFNDLKDAQK